jgi:hypothetical protein
MVRVSRSHSGMLADFAGLVEVGERLTCAGLILGPVDRSHQLWTIQAYQSSSSRSTAAWPARMRARACSVRRSSPRSSSSRRIPYKRVALVSAVAQRLLLHAAADLVDDDVAEADHMEAVDDDLGTTRPRWSSRSSAPPRRRPHARPAAESRTIRPARHRLDCTPTWPSSRSLGQPRLSKGLRRSGGKPRHTAPSLPLPTS